MARDTMIHTDAAFAKLSASVKTLRQKPLYLNAYALIASNLFNAASSYLFWIIAARRFTADAVGTASATLASMALLDVLANLGLEPGLIRFLSGMKNEQESTRLIQVTTTLRLIVTFIITGIFIWGLRWWAPGLPIFFQQPDYWIVFVPLALANGLFTLLNAVFIALRKAQYVLFTSLVFNILKIAGLLMASSAMEALSITASVAIALTIVVLIEVGGFLPHLLTSYKPKLRISVSKLRSFFTYSAINQIADILLGFPQMVLPILVINHLGAQANARFYTAWMTAGILRTACISISQSAFAEGAAAYNEGHTRHTNFQRSISLNLATALIGGGLLATTGTWILRLFGKSYSETGTPLLCWLLVSVVPFSLVNLHITALRVRKQTSLLILVTAAWAVISLGSTFLGIQTRGLTGVATGWTLAQFITMALSLALWLWQRYPKTTTVTQ